LKKERDAILLKQDLLERERAAAAALETVEYARKNVRNAQLGLDTSQTQHRKGAHDLQRATTDLEEVQADLKALDCENVTLVGCANVLICFPARS